MPHLKTIDGVEVFAVGEWNGDNYTTEDLDIMVDAFQETSETFTPPLKFGHDDNQTILQQDGLPAAGWISNLRRMGEKLIADFVDIPKQVFELIKNKAYDTVSAEIFWDAKVNGVSYKRVLSAVALLGADVPAVTNLQRIRDRFKLKGSVKRYDLKQKAFMIELDASLLKQYSGKKGAAMPEENDELTKKLEDGDGQIEALKAQVTTLKAELEALKKAAKKTQEEEEPEQVEEKKENTKKDGEIKKLNSKVDALNAQLKDQGIDKAVDQLHSEKLITKSMKPFVKQLLGEELKTYSFKVGEEDKEFSKEGLLREVLKLHTIAEKVNLKESSEATKTAKDAQALDTKINAYAKEHKVTYGAAYKAVHKTLNVA